MLIERTNYFAKAGRFEDVLQTRRRASEVRTRLGLARGAIAVRVVPGSEGPDVTWECQFESPEAHARDLAVRAASPEFEAVRARMRALIDRFERHVMQVDELEPGRHPRGPDPRPEAPAHGLAGTSVVPERVRFRSNGFELAGYLYRAPGHGRAPCILLNHGSTIHRGTTDVCRPGMAALLRSWGYATFLPHRRGYGDSEGPPWREEVPADFGTPEYDRQLTDRLSRESDDVLAALEFLDGGQESVPPAVAVMGSSFGGTVSLLAAARCPRFRCAVDFAGAAMNWERTPALREAMLAAARDLRVPIFLVSAANDYSTAPTRELGALLERPGTPHQARVFPPFGLSADEGHLFAWTGALVWGAEVRGFLTRHLGTGR